MTNVTRVPQITKASVYIEDGTYYLAIEGEDNFSYISIPKVNINSFVLTQEDEMVNGHIFFARKVNVQMAVEPGEEPYSFYTKKTKAKELTIAEIEKELGYRIKIKG